MLFTIVPAEEPSTRFNSAAVAVTPLRIFNSAAVAETFVPPISRVSTLISPPTVTTPSARVIRSVSAAHPIVLPSGITNEPPLPLSVNTPVLDSFIFSAAASLAPVLKDNLVALLFAAKSPSETASIPAATKIASVPVPSSGAWKLIAPITSFSAISVSPVANVKTTGLSSPVAECFKVNPLLWT